MRAPKTPTSEEMGNPADRSAGFLNRRYEGVTGFIVALVLASLGIVGALLFTHDQSAAPPTAEAAVQVVPGTSYCTASGIDDLYTGDGHVQFFLTLTNGGGEPRTVSITPVRHYDDGELNLSGLDTVEVEVAAHQTWSGRIPAYTYEAHAHEVIGCGVIVDGGDEITIEALRL